MAENQSVPEISEYYGATCESKMKFKINADGNTISLNTLDAIELQNTLFLKYLVNIYLGYNRIQNY